MTTSTEPASVSTPFSGSYCGQSIRSRSSNKLDDVTSLTSFNPFAEEDENDQAPYTFTSLLSRVKNTFSAPLTSNTTATPSSTRDQNAAFNTPPAEQRRPSFTTTQTQNSTSSTKSQNAEKPFQLVTPSALAAPPLVSLTPAQSETPTFTIEYEPSLAHKSTLDSPVYEPGEGMPFGTSIPGFPIQDDARSIRTTTSFHRPGSVSKVMRRLRGEGLSKDYWMDDENCKECYDCKSVFTTWRRKHHCRICGQIFCSRCASNIIKGTRFGQSGMIRVCNLCLPKLSKVDEDDEDDRRSIISSATFPAHQFGFDTISGLGHPESPFAASQLFGRDEAFNLYSIAETRRVIYGSVNGSPTMPSLPYKDDPNWGSIRDNPPPFRRALSDEEEKGPNLLENFPSDVTVSVEPTTPMKEGSTLPIKIPGTTNFIQFPVGSPERGIENSQSNSHQLQPSDPEMATPFIRSRVQSRIDTLAPVMEPGWRTRRESTAYAQELNLISMMHLRIMLRQMLLKEKIPNIKEWEETLLKLALRIARELTFTSLPYRQGEDMDVRRYVKIKKIPGGRPCDSEYVNGAVISKNVAHKRMSRLQNNPRVMLITFPLEFYRVEGQYMQFGQILRQEKEYLGNLASRVAALRPHVVLVEKTVSRLALDALAEHNIAVARNVKPSAIATVARMTQADEFSSIDKLALEPRLGHCTQYRIQTYDHPLIPGRRKTYMRFEGCSSDLGCTLVLRGGDLETLRRIKKVTRFLTFIVRNLKLETHLWKDSVISLPSFNPEAIPITVARNLGRLSINTKSHFLQSSSLSTPRLMTPSSGLLDVSPSPPIPKTENSDADLPSEDAEQLRLSRRIEQSLEPYRTTFTSVSATLRFPPPYPIRKMKELDDELHAAKGAWEDDVVLKGEKAQAKSSAEPAAVVITGGPPPFEGSDRDDINAQIEALSVPIPTSPSSASLRAMTEEGSYFAGVPPGFSSTTEASSSSTSQALIEEPLEPIKTTADIALESKYRRLEWKHEEHRRIWEWYLRKNADDFIVEKYQRIFLLEYTIPTSEIGQHRACFAPQFTCIQFYGENDMALGQFIEKAVVETLGHILDPKAICAGKGCDQPLARHCKVYVHNETRLFVAVEQWDGQFVNRVFSPAPDLITTWSACRVCGSATPFIPVSPEMQRYSFAKFLELHFYPADVKLVQGAGCEHNIYQHHIRYFASRGMTVRFQTDPVVMHEIVYPPFRIHVRPETQLEIRNADFQKLHRKNFAWYSKLIDELKSICIEAAIGDEQADAHLKTEVNIFISRAEAEREEISRRINETYRESAPTDTLALNHVHAFRQDKIVALQRDLDRLPKPKAATVIDRGNQKTSAFNTVGIIWPQGPGLGLLRDRSLTSIFAQETEESQHLKKPLDQDPFISSASDISEPEPEPEPTRVPGPGVLDSEQEQESEANLETFAQSESEEPTSSNTKSSAIEGSNKSDGDSDSTIGAHRNGAPVEDVPQDQFQEGNSFIAKTTTQHVSKVPRRTVNQPSVAELVKRYQDFIPAQSMSDLAKSALPPKPAVSESEQEYPTTIQRRPIRRGRPPGTTRKLSTSDFESSYAANIAPRYLMHRRPGHVGSRIPGPSGQLSDSYESSRKTSPEKRSSHSKSKDVRFSRPSSPPNSTGKPNVISVKQPKVRVASRTKEKPVGKSNSHRPPSSNTKVMAMAKSFDRLNREVERTKGRYNILRGKRARPVTSVRATVEVLDSVKDALRDDIDPPDSSSEADDEGDGIEEGRLPGPPGPSAESPPTVLLSEQAVELATGEPHSAAPETTPPLSTSQDHSGTETSHLQLTPATAPLKPMPLPAPQLLPLTKPDVTTPGPDLDVPTSGPQSIFKALSEFWQPRLSAELEDSMSDPEHIFRDSSMIVRIDEPTSIVALALNSSQYREMLAKSRTEKKTAREPTLIEGEMFMPDDRSIAESTSTWGVVNIDSSDPVDPTEDLKLPSSKLPWAISFESGGLTISCTILYPEQFDALQRTYGCEKSMVESLSRCVKWDASGGKSGSAFLKTRDDRFIAKELSKFEVQTMESFAPAYFDYMSSAVSANRPTLLAKVFGCYKLTFRKTGKGRGPGKFKSTQMNLLVMENLFCDRQFTKIYDLKGSTRNRHVRSTGRENEVLLDENLVQTAHLNPFYLREHSKRILRGALYNDSKFLADINVMDYSLVCGVDSKNNELVVGIVDYIRTYTWDKKLESWVKEWGAGKEPTIVTPKQYRQRFISAMERYFPMIPDRWMKQRDMPEEDPNVLSELWPDW